MSLDKADDDPIDEDDDGDGGEGNEGGDDGSVGGQSGDFGQADSAEEEAGDWYHFCYGIWIEISEVAEAMDSEDESDSDDGPGLSDSTMDNSLRSDRENSDMLVDDYERYNYL